MQVGHNQYYHSSRPQEYVACGCHLYLHYPRKYEKLKKIHMPNHTNWLTHISYETESSFINARIHQTYILDKVKLEKKGVDIIKPKVMIYLNELEEDGTLLDYARKKKIYYIEYALRDFGHLEDWQELKAKYTLLKLGGEVNGRY